MTTKRIGSHSHEVAMKNSDFHIQDGSTYYIAHPNSIDGGNVIDVPHIITGGNGGASHDTGNAYKVWTSTLNGSNAPNSFWGPPWNSHDENSATPARLIRNLIQPIQLSAIEWQGEGNTGYGPISGPRSITINIYSTPTTTGYNSGNGDILSQTVETQNLDWGANQSSPQGLAEVFDLTQYNGGNAITAQYLSIDCHTSWDTRNMVVRRIKLREHLDGGDSSITATIDDTVNSFRFRDVNGNTNEGSFTRFNIGSDTVQFGLASVGKTFEAVRVDNKFIFFGSDGTETEGIV